MGGGTTGPGACPRNVDWKLTNYSTGHTAQDKFHQSPRVAQNQCTEQICMGSMMTLPGMAPTSRCQEEILKMAKEFMDEFYTSLNSFQSEHHEKRWTEVLHSVAATGTYSLTGDELLFGAKLAWRNASRCIGRIQWNKLKVFDARQAETTEDMFEALCEHIVYATNKGNIRSTITVFPQREDGKKDFRVWNMQLISYAGYQEDDGTVVGDPINVDFTKLCTKLGWRSERTKWDILPLVLSAAGKPPDLFDLPNDIVLQVHLTHPTYWWFKDLGLRWYALPAVSGMLFDVGGVQFPSCPFNGWYMSTEVGCRDLCDPQRYNILEMVAAEMGEDTSNDATLWKDRALVEVNVAVLHSFQQKTITIVDHHTASDNFIKHLENEQKARNGCPADWVWIVPPMSGSLTSVFHQEMALYNVKPAYEYQQPAWKTHDWGESNVRVECRFKLKTVARLVWLCSHFYSAAVKRRINVAIIYATETGKSQVFADKLATIMAHGFNPKVSCMIDFDVTQLLKESLVLVVTSTFGNGDAPENGLEFSRQLHSMNMRDSENETEMRRNDNKETNNNNNNYSNNIVDNHDLITIGNKKIKPQGLNHMRYAVFALGSSVYPNFCAFGHHVDKLLHNLGGQRLLPVTEGDEMSGQQKSFRSWLSEIYPLSCSSLGLSSDMTVLEKELKADEVKLTENTVRLVSARGDLLEGALAKAVKKNVTLCKVISTTHLHRNAENRATTVLVKLASDESYQPGDHVAVMPENRQDLVDAILERLVGIVLPHKVVKLQILTEKKSGQGTIHTWSPYGTLPTCSLRVLLTRFLDLTSPLRPNQLEALASLTSQEGHRDRLVQLATNPSAYEEWRAWKLPTLLEVLEEFPSVRLTPALLVSIMKPLQPRYYSISSSPVLNEGEIHLTVAVVSYKSEGGAGSHRYGVCSNYLLDCKTGDDVYLFTRKAHNFSLPLDVSKPVIMVGPGTGIAPFRGFWQHRMTQLRDAETEAARREYGKLWLFFGCREKAMDLFHDEKADMVKKGVLEKSFVALSRDPNTPKTYVQTLLETEGASVYRMLHDEGGHVFVCGDVTMAEGVGQMLQAIAEKQGNVDFVKGLKEEKRYHEDIFGVTSHSVVNTRDDIVPRSKKRHGLISRVWCCGRMTRNSIQPITIVDY